MFNAPDKDPAALIDYSLNWSPWLDGDTISGYSVTAESGITVSSVVGGSAIVAWWLSGGTAGRTYDITVEITTAAGRLDQRTVRVYVVNR